MIRTLFAHQRGYCTGRTLIRIIRRLDLRTCLIRQSYFAMPADRYTRAAAIFVIVFAVSLSVLSIPALAQDDGLDHENPTWGRGGFTPVLGGISQTAGTTVGLRYDAFLRQPNLTLAVDARASIRRYVGFGFVGGYQDDGVATYAFARYNYMPGEIFYGIGPGTSRSNRGDYRLDEYAAGGIVGFRLSDLVAVGAHGSILDLRWGSGRLGDIPAVEDAFEEAGVAGVGVDAQYVPIGIWAELDTRRLPRQRRYGARTSIGQPSLDGHALGTNQGYYLSAEFRPMLAVDDISASFSQWEMEAQYFVPLRFSADGLAFRLHATGVIEVDEPVPFYLLPALGGSHSIRGFHPARFRDNNSYVVNLEYRRNLWLFLDGAAFMDFGQVFDQASDISLADTEFGYGAGLMVRLGRFILGRADLAHSRDGFQLYLRAGAFL
jgi:hypothetical protein